MSMRVFFCSKHWNVQRVKKHTCCTAYTIHPRNCTVDHYIIVLLITLREYMCSIAFIVWICYLCIQQNQSTGGKRKTFICLICCCCCCCYCWQFLYFECWNMFYFTTPCLMDQYQCNSSSSSSTKQIKYTFRKFLDRCQIGWSYFPVWMLFREPLTCSCTVRVWELEEG